MLTYDEQLHHLRDGGMTIDDEAEAERWLRHVSYYRLSAYWLYFEEAKQQGGPRFRSGTRFSQITELYDFDRDLRRLVMRGTEHVEVALRGSWAYQLASLGGGHRYLEPALYTVRKEFDRALEKLTTDVAASNETYIKHYRTRYQAPALPPVWMVAEMMSFGQLSRWYSNLADRALRNRIADPVDLPETVLVPFIRHLTDVRNICAHHGRLWNRGFLRPPKLSRKPEELALSLDLAATQAPARLYNSLTFIAFLISRVAPASSWAGDVSTLVASQPLDRQQAMGCPPDWRSRPIWSDC